MTVFQYITIGILGLLTVFSIWALARGRARPLVAVAWIMVWISALAAILFPEAITVVAQFLGIKRGADLILYGSVLASLMGFFYLLTKFRATQRQITLLTRKMAIYDAELDRTSRSEVSGDEGDESGEGIS